MLTSIVAQSDYSDEIIVNIIDGLQKGKNHQIEKVRLESAKDSTSELHNSVYLGIAGGVKYQSIGGEKERGISHSGLLSIMFNVGEKETSFLGIEAKYYQYGWDTRYDIDNVIFLTPFYQWNSFLFSNTFLVMQIGITIFSNNLALFFSNSLDIGFNYKLNHIIFFAKNSLNVQYLLLSNIVSIINMGVYISI